MRVAKRLHGRRPDRDRCEGVSRLPACGALERAALERHAGAARAGRARLGQLRRRRRLRGGRAAHERLGEPDRALGRAGLVARRARRAGRQQAARRSLVHRGADLHGGRPARRRLPGALRRAPRRLRLARRAGPGAVVARHGGIVSSFEAVSCAGPAFCAAVGNYAKSGRYPYPQPLAGVWNGDGWRVEAIPHRHPELNLEGVACLTASSCQAVGYTLNGTLAIGWNGTAWTLDPTPPSHSTEQFPSGLSAVSAVPGGGFFAVGYSHRVRALVEQHP